MSPPPRRERARGASPRTTATTKRLTRLAGPLLASGVFALAGLLVEGAARLIASRANSRAERTHSVLRYSPEFGWDKAPGEEAWLDNGEARVLLRVNSRGLRGPDRAHEKPAGTRRILLLGDSFCEGASASDEESVRGVLESRLCASGSKVEVLNGGTSGWGTDQAMLFFEKEGLRYAPDEVVLLVFGNDLADNMGQRKKPWFALEDGRLVPRNSPPPAPPGGLERRAADPPKPLLPWRGSMALRLLGVRTETSRPALHRRLATLGLVPPLEDHPPTRAWLLGYGPDTGETAARWAVFEALLVRLRDAVTASGAHLTVLDVPASFEVDPADWERTRDRWELDGPGWEPDRIARGVALVCQRLGVPRIDPRPALRQAGVRTYLRGDPHWNATGQRITAEVLARALEAEAGRAPAPERRHAR